MWQGFSEEAIDILESNHRVIVRQILVKNADGVTLQDITDSCTDGAVTWDETAATFGAITLAVNDATLVPRNGVVTDLLHPLSGNEVWPYKGVWVPGASAPELAPMGVYRMTVPVVEDGNVSTSSTITTAGALPKSLSSTQAGTPGIQVSLTGHDRSGTIAMQKWLGPYTAAANQPVATAIKAIINARWRGSPIQYNFAPTTYVVPKGTILGIQFSSTGVANASGSTSGSNNPWADCVALAKAAGMVLFFDRQGICTMTPAVIPANVAPLFTFQEGPFCSVLSATRTLDETAFVNAFQVIGTGAVVTNSDGSTSPGAPVLGYAYSTDPNLGVSGPLGEIPGQLVVDTISTLAQANVAAAAQLALGYRALSETSFTAADDPRLDATDALYLVREQLDGNATPGPWNSYVCQSVIHPFNLIDAMQVTNRPYTIDASAFGVGGTNALVVGQVTVTAVASLDPGGFNVGAIVTPQAHTSVTVSGSAAGSIASAAPTATASATVSGVVAGGGGTAPVQQTGLATSTGNNFEIPFPNPVATGNSVVLLFGNPTDGNTIVSINGGASSWTKAVQELGGPVADCEIWYGPTNAGDTNITMVLSGVAGTVYGALAVEWPGPLTLDKVGTVAPATFVTSGNGPSLAPTNPGEVFFSIIATGTSQTAIGGGFTHLTNSGIGGVPTSLMFGYLYETGTLAEQMTSTFPSSEFAAAGCVFIQSSGVTSVQGSVTAAAQASVTAIGTGGGGGAAPTLPADAVVGTPTWRMIDWGGQIWSYQGSGLAAWVGNGHAGYEITWDAIFGLGGAYPFLGGTASGASYPDQERMQGSTGTIAAASAAGFETYLGFYVQAQPGSGAVPSGIGVLYGDWLPYGNWWSDPAWALANTNWTTAAAAVNFMGMTGIAFDSEPAIWTPNTNQAQIVTVTGTSGTFQLQYGGQITASISYTTSLSAAGLQTVIQNALTSTYGAGVVSVAGNNGGPYYVVFIGGGFIGGLNLMTVASQSGVTVTVANATTAQVNAEARARGNALAQAIWGQVPGILLLWYHEYPPGGWQDIIQIQNGGTVPHAYGAQDAFFQGLWDGMRAVGATGRIILADASFYRDATAVGVTGASGNQAAHFINSQGPRSWFSLNYDQAVWNYMCDKLDITAFTFRGADTSTFYKNTEPTDIDWAQMVMDARHYCEGPRRVEYNFGGQWAGNPQMTGGANEPWSYTDAAMLGTTGGSTGSIPASSQTAISTSVPTLTSVSAAAVSGGNTIITCNAAHAYGIRYVKIYNGTTFSAGNPGASYIGAMNMTFNANGGGYTSNYNSAFQSCTFTTPASAGQYFVLEAVSVKDDTHWTSIQVPGAAGPTAVVSATASVTVNGTSTLVPHATAAAIASVTVASITHPTIASTFAILESSTEVTPIVSSAETTTTGHGLLAVIAIRAESDGSPVTVTSITDTPGNTWVKVSSVNSGSSPYTGSFIEVWNTNNANPTGLSGGTVSINLSTARIAAARVWEISGGHNAGLVDKNTLIALAGTGTFNSGSSGTLTGTSELAIGFVTRGGAADTVSGVTFTQGAETSPQPSATTMDNSVGVTSSENIHSGSLVITTTTAQSYSGTMGVSCDGAGIIVLANGP